MATFSAEMDLKDSLVSTKQTEDLEDLPKDIVKKLKLMEKAFK